MVTIKSFFCHLAWSLIFCGVYALPIILMAAVEGYKDGTTIPGDLSLSLFLIITGFWLRRRTNAYTH